MSFNQLVDLVGTEPAVGGEPRKGQLNGLDFLILVDGKAEGRPGGIRKCGHLVFVGASANLIGVSGPDGQDRGYVIGWPRTDTPLRGWNSISGPAPGQAYDDWARSFSGNFVCFLRDDAGRGSFYLDATGSLGMVYHAATRSVASIPDLLPVVADRVGTEFDENRRREIGQRAHYGFGATSVDGVQRLTPNFALSEADFEARRFWPRGDAQGGPVDDLELTRDIFAKVRRNIGRVVQGGRAGLHLTAGTDTRMVLAAAWELRDRVPFFTFANSARARSIDIEVAPRLAREFGLAHFIVSCDPPDPERFGEISARTGYCVADGGFAVAPISDLVQGHWDFVGGVGGEIGRAFYWRHADLGRGRPTAAELLERVHVVSRPGTLAAAERWLESLPRDMSAPQIWDLAYLEQRLGHWAGAMSYGFRGGRPATSAFNSFDVVREKLRLSPEYRVSGGYARDFILTGSDRLLEIPINRRSGARRLLDAKEIVKSCLPAELFWSIRSGAARMESLRRVSGLVQRKDRRERRRGMV